MHMPVVALAGTKAQLFFKNGAIASIFAGSPALKAQPASFGRRRAPACRTRRPAIPQVLARVARIEHV